MEQPNKTEINKINQFLINKYGLVGVDRKPKYKVVWSEDCFEPRYVEVIKYDENGNFLGVEKGVEVRKKWNWIVNRYLLVMYNEGPKEQGDIKEWDGYEALHNFDSGGEYLQPTILACEFMIWVLHNIAPATKHQDKDEAEKIDEAEYQQNLAEITEAGKLFEGETVGYTGKEFSQ